MPTPRDRLDYLDGLRGWAALAVVIFHSTWELFGPVVPQIRRHWPGPLNDGRLAVQVFFVLSGLVLTHAFVRTGDRQRLKVMALGRYVRLAVPVLLASFIGYAMLKPGCSSTRRLRPSFPMRGCGSRSRRRRRRSRHG